MQRLRINNSRLREITLFAGRTSLPVYLVGGAVRDLILGSKNLDFDIVSVGSPSSLVRKLAKKWNADVRSFGRFKTFAVNLRDGSHIDFATARKEVYASPGKLPEVTESSLADDILRRDFTINALAVSLNKEDFGLLIDLCGGTRDLKTGVLRVLHNKSFKDDPTRILRLARFISRGFKVDHKTERQVLRYRNFISRISDERISKEVLEILDEKKPSLAFKFLKKRGLYEKILPGVNYASVINRIDRPKTLEDKFGVLLSGMNKFQARVFLEKMKLGRSLKQKIQDKARSETKPILNGNDLIRMGFTPGPVFKKIFDALNKKKFSSRNAAKRFISDNFV